jgi:hypothetical protein
VEPVARRADVAEFPDAGEETIVGVAPYRGSGEVRPGDVRAGRLDTPGAEESPEAVHDLDPDEAGGVRPC